MDIHDTVLLLSPYSTDYYTSRLFSGKYATVSQGFVANFLTFYRNPFNLIVDGKAYTPTITEDKWALPLSVITSYSIHYTKLYDMLLFFTSTRYAIS